MRRALLLVLPILSLACSDALVPKVGARIDGVDASSPPVTDAAAETSNEVSFARDIRPLMNRSETDPNGHGCKKCHYKSNPPAIGVALAGLDLETLGSLRRGGSTSGKDIVVPGKPEASAIVKKLRGTYPFGTRMPKDGPAFWTEEQIALVERWIREGAKGADDE